MEEKNKMRELEGSSGMLYPKDPTAESAVNGSQTEGSEKEASRSESSFDADSEASESESASKQSAFSSSSNLSALHVNHINVKMPHTKPSDNSDEVISSAISKLSFCDTINEDEKSSRGDSGLSNNSMFSVDKSSLSQNPQNAFQTLSQTYITSSKECSVQSCLYQFTSVELLMGNNKLLCESCTERKQKYQKKTNSTGNLLVSKYEYVWGFLSKQVQPLMFHCSSMGFPLVAEQKMSSQTEPACKNILQILKHNSRCNLEFMLHLLFISIQDKSFKDYHKLNRLIIWY